jgi:hypothetical protein
MNINVSYWLSWFPMLLFWLGLVLLPMGLLLRRLGRHPAWCLIALVPGLNLLSLWLLFALSQPEAAAPAEARSRA